ncbi:hypothetical protein GCM10010975_35500 [Comamonas phosphati]|nr:hypothetical protein GCM10010975_35500 [Comamonas phosphati]
MSTEKNAEKTNMEEPWPSAAEFSAGERRSIQWCLLSHTNIGKTTLTRTLARDDVGEIEDAAHITSQSERYLLQTSGQGDELWLWDTPGFGDSVRLYERLRQHCNPLGWFLSNVWDRWHDKPFYLSQRALLAARDHADVMLYLVNAAEDPADAGYWSAEMQILRWLDKPVIVLLNQIGSDTTQEQTQADLQRWRTATQSFADTVREVLVLDAFTRSWWHERRMMQSIAPLLPEGKQPAYRRLLQAREARQQQCEQQSLQALAQQLVATAQLQESQDPAQGKLLARAWQALSGKVAATLGGKAAGQDADLPSDPQAQAAIRKLLQSVQQADVQATQRLLELHQLDGLAASQIQEQLRSQLQVSAPIDPQAAGLWGALTAGAATGLGADLVAGGLTLGTGALVGALVGAVTFAGAAWGSNKVLDRDAQRFQLSGEYLTALAGQVLLKYLVISHFGRGRGRYSSPCAPRHWNEAVQAAVSAHAQQWSQGWEALRAPQPAGEDAVAEVQRLLQDCLGQIMERLYPELNS